MSLRKGNTKIAGLGKCVSSLGGATGSVGLWNGLKIDNNALLIDGGDISLGSTISDRNDTVTEYYVSSDGNTWYRKWASGWKECGIYFSATATYTNYVLPINFTNSQFTTIASPQGNTTVAIYPVIKDGISYVGMSVGSGDEQGRVYCCGY